MNIVSTCVAPQHGAELITQVFILPLMVAPIKHTK